MQKFSLNDKTNLKMFAKPISTLLAALCIFNLTNAAIIKPSHTGKAKEMWELFEAIFADSQTREFNGTWITDNEFYYTAPDRSIHKYNAATNADTIFVPSAILALYGISSKFKLSPDNKKILVRYDVENIFRHSAIAKYDVYNLETKNVIQIHGGRKLNYCGWSPFKDRLAYVFENNVYVHFEDGNEIQLTEDGVTGVIYNGVPDWVYEEEVLSRDSALWWSPDGLKLIVGNFNDKNVKTFHYAIYGNAEEAFQYPKDENLKYPKPGTPNPVVELRVFDLSSTEAAVLEHVTLTAPTAIVSDDHIMQDIAWIDNKNLLVLWLNRRQNVGTLQSCTLAGRCKEVKHFEEPDGWIRLSTPKCLSNGESCIFSYWIGDWYQVWNLNLNTGTNVWKSRGDFTVTAVYGYDEENDKLYYQATLKGQPYINHVFSNDNCLTCDLRFDENEFCLNAAAAFSKNFSYYSVTCSGPGPRYSKIFETNTKKLVKDWELNLAFRQRISSKMLPIVRFVNVSLADGSVASVRLKLPPFLDEKKKYPMIVNPYAGPNSVRAVNSFKIGFEGYLTTTRGFIYATIDGRGTGNKGKKVLFSVNNNLGTHEVEDQIYVTQYLQNNLPYVDRDRTGIWGWSYGGYVTAKTIGNDTDHVFQCGIAVAPVTSWLYYDSIYTERYMGLPTKEDNLHNYEESSVFKRVNNFRNHDFLLIHGSADDNVHYQQSLALAKELEENDILFEQMTYVDENHSIGSFSVHLYHTMEHFWINYLNPEIEDEEVEK